MKLNMGIPIDAGCFVIIDYDSIKDWLGSDETRLPIAEAKTDSIYQKGPIKINLDAGFYSVVYKVTTWDGNLTGQSRIHVKSGKLIVADLCHIVDPNKWQDLIEGTNCFKSFRDNPHSIVVDTGADGDFAVSLEIKQLVTKGRISQST